MIEIIFQCLAISFILYLIVDIIRLKLKGQKIYDDGDEEQEWYW